MSGARFSKLVFLFVLAGCVLLQAFAPVPGRAAQPAGPLRAAVSGPYPPFAELDENGKVYGFDVDIAEALCRELGRECEVANLDFDDLIPALRENKIDFIVAGMGASPERLEQVDFTERYYRSVSIFVERKGTFSEFTPETVKGRRVGAQTATLQADYLTKTYGSEITLVTAPSYEEVFEMLSKGEIDLVLSDGLPGYSYLTSEQGQDLETIGPAVETGNLIDYACIAVRKGDNELRLGINEAIQSLRRSGAYDKINRKYFDFIIY